MPTKKSKSDTRALASLWIGPALSYLEVICLKSMLAHGHRVILYAYQDVAHIPDGVETRDAREIFDPGVLYIHERTLTPAIHADFFRLEMLAKTDHIWVDTDLYLLKPMPLEDAYIFGFEHGQSVGNSVLALPKTSSALNMMRETVMSNLETVESFRPPEYADAFGTGYAAVALKMHIATMGPQTVTGALHATGEVEHARPVETFYPVPIGRAGVFTRVSEKVQLFTTDDTIGIHMWSWRLDNVISKSDYFVSEQSFIAKACRDHDVSREDIPLSIVPDMIVTNQA